MLCPAHHNQLGVIDPDREQGHRPRALTRLGLLRRRRDRIVPPLAPLNGKDVAPLLPAQLLISRLGQATRTTGVDTRRGNPHLRPGFVLEGLIEIVKKLVPDFGFKRVAPEDLMIEAPTFLAQPPADALELKAILLHVDTARLDADFHRNLRWERLSARDQLLDLERLGLFLPGFRKRDVDEGLQIPGRFLVQEGLHDHLQLHKAGIEPVEMIGRMPPERLLCLPPMPQPLSVSDGKVPISVRPNTAIRPALVIGALGHVLAVRVLLPFDV